MSLKTRLEKIEKASNPEELLNVILLTPREDKPLPEPVVMGGVRVIHRYEDEQARQK